MQVTFDSLGRLLALLRSGFLAVAAVVAVVSVLDWLVRTRRVSPFSLLARTMRRWVDPALRPVERRVVRSGGMPSSAPWWALAAVVITGIVVISLLEFLQSQVAYISLSVDSGPRGLARLLVTWTFGVLQLALIVRVLLTWVSARPGAWYWRWSWRLTEPFLKPLRQLIPQIGQIDVTPIVAWFALSLLQTFVLRVI